MVKNKLTITASVLLALAAFASAQYLIPWQSCNSGGAPGTGTGYALNGSVGQPVQGTGTGTGGVGPGYRGYWGFWVPMVEDTTHGWTEMTKMLLVPSTKYIKDGGWMAYNSGNGRIYAAKGNKTQDFYAYFVAGDSWHQQALWPDGIEAKKPGKGAAGCCDGNGIAFATKGNNKQGFWAYYVDGDSWRQKKDVPLGVSNKKVKGGTGIVWAVKGGTGDPYLLKGYKNEFYRYHSDGDSWQTLPPAPIGSNVKWDKGSWLAYDGADKIYAFKAKYHEFYRYHLDGDSWSAALAPMPVAGSGGSKKAKDGSCGAFKGGKVYALKGGNTQEFWCYTVATNTWAELDTIPKFGSTGKKKKVKAGASIVAVDQVLYATKGNKCNELWKYKPAASFGGEPMPSREGVMAERLAIGDWRLAIAPNPIVSGYAALHYSLPKAGPATLRIFDVAGRSVLTQTLIAGRSGSVGLDLRHLSTGVYLAKLAADDFSTTQKLVLQR